MPLMLTFVDTYRTDRYETREEPLLLRTIVVLHEMYVLIWIVGCVLNHLRNRRETKKIRTEIPVNIILQA